ncbi:MAG TPA: 1-deoxy-D-xylulose-5-phosphate reductoisomerase [Bacteroidales bacterium]|nr:1-deoxy-D-xylulose-5-phosphate reductoisomerase [Bacteroidales bacterium]
MKKRIAILGSTGSIGTQALEIIREFPDIFLAEVLTADSNADLLIEQSLEFMPNAVVITNDRYFLKVKSALEKHDIKVFSGTASLEQIVEMETIDMVLAGIVGFAGLRPTLNAIRHRKPLALANKETLVVAGDIITREAKENAVNIYPVDSEHSAIFQCLAGEFHNPVEKIFLTASGGPFKGRDKASLAEITRAEALNHPNWVMGNKITIDSATLMNKGLEVIEAKWLFNLKPEQIEVLVHPQSVIHSMVQFADGSIKAQLGMPDMRLPILYALNYPVRLKTSFPRIDWLKTGVFTFEPPDTKTFRNLDLAYEALKLGGNMPCILNAANEMAVGAFLNDEIKFPDIADVIEQSMQKAAFIKNPSLDDYFMSDMETRKISEEIIKNNYK